MFSFLKKLLELFKKNEIKDKEINALYSKLKELYNYDDIAQERKQELARLIEKNGYLPYSYLLCRVFERLSVFFPPYVTCVL